MCEKWQSKSHLHSQYCEGWQLLMAFQGPGLRLNPLSTSLIQSSDHYKVSVIIIPILQMKFKAIEVNDYTAESSALALHNSYK